MVFEKLFLGGGIRSIVRMMEYEKIYQFESLYRACKMAARSKRYKNEVVEFEFDLAGSLWRLHDELESRKYHPSRTTVL